MERYNLKYTGNEIDKLLQQTEKDAQIYSVTVSTANPDTFAAACVEPLNKVYQDYLKGIYSMICVSSSYGNGGSNGLYTIDEVDEDSITLRNNYTTTSGQSIVGSVTPLQGTHWGMAGTIENGVVISCKMWNRYAQGIGSFLSTSADYSTPYQPKYAGSPATKQYVDNSIANIDFSNILTQNGTIEYQPTEANDVTTKQYVDEAINNAVINQLNEAY